MPEFTLWRLVNGDRVVEARTRIVPLDEGGPEFRLLMSRADGTFDIL